MIAEEWDRENLFRMRARPLEVTDGDTFWALCEHPHYSRAEASIRLRGFDAPELHEDGGEAAKACLSEILTVWRWYDRKEWPLRIVSVQKVRVVSEQKSFDRYISDILIVQPDGELIDVRDLL